MTALLEVKDLQTHFLTRAGVVKAVDGVSFSLNAHETLGIVGESGSGKSVTVMSLLGLIPRPPGKIVGGSAMFAGRDLLKLSEAELRSIRGKRIGMIFQDPMTSLNPYLTVATQLTEGVMLHERISKKAARERAIEALTEVGISEPERRLDSYPHQFSGGMRQRVMIAMAIITRPDILIADEPTTALDVTVQAQILELLKKIQKTNGMGLILITHDLGVVAGIADKVLVMYAGRPVEKGAVREVFYERRHPYTAGLLDSIPKIDFDEHGKIPKLEAIPGLCPDPSRLPPGCAFAPRCKYAMDVCKKDVSVPLRESTSGHYSVCHLEGATL